MQFWNIRLCESYYYGNYYFKLFHLFLIIYTSLNFLFFLFPLTKKIYFSSFIPSNIPSIIYKTNSYTSYKFICISLSKHFLSPEFFFLVEDPKSMNAKRLQEVQSLVEKKVNRIWTDVSAFEESSATCISDMLLHVAAGAYIEGLRMATQFVTHLEVLFSALDWINIVLIDEGEGNYKHT